MFLTCTKLGEKHSAEQARREFRRWSLAAKLSILIPAHVMEALWRLRECTQECQGPRGCPPDLDHSTSDRAAPQAGLILPLLNKEKTPSWQSVPVSPSKAVPKNYFQPTPFITDHSYLIARIGGSSSTVRSCRSPPPDAVDPITPNAPANSVRHSSSFMAS
ncbi:hypothetical protein MYCTH_2127797 [Thermothelomyces thermophilus ATCC 42464]|uniref:Uncharacterized protein n=1 Tax=Thermothelomyces thermophilus (strain ATCC 42464 / BCRC 31852 / DSM 1799) TaxID=573729 RepID=G2QH87_THET4|nr:uncharacterized protein MYCTH_2127797 [Thermothelomyces thermophilus ATCC 42464]AEO58747.1 hypothetical protein MYCTH_2127797 [Thermothelomyces thermophilus ATCC 42464]